MHEAVTTRKKKRCKEKHETRAPSWLLWILTVMPVCQYFSSFLLCSVSFFFFFFACLLFCFLTINCIYFMSVRCVWFLLSDVSLQSYWAWKPSKLGLSISFSLSGFEELCSSYNDVNYGPWHVYKPLNFSVATCGLACSEMSLSLRQKALGLSWKRSDIVQFGRWRDNFSSAPCFVLW